MRTITELIKHYSLDFRKGKTELQIRNFEKEYFENQEIIFTAILREIEVDSPNLNIWLIIPSIMEEVGETVYKDGLYYLVTIFKDISVTITYPQSNDTFKLSSFSKGENVLVKGLINYINNHLISMKLLSIEKTDIIDQKPSFTRKLPEEGDTLNKQVFEYNKSHYKKIKEEAEQKKGQCFIATACYGTYDAPEVLVLRQYRDDKLIKTSYGKVFVRFYYSVSPFFAALISNSDLLKKTVLKYFLEPIVTKLQRKGY